MPIVSALGAMSSRGFGEFAQSSAGTGVKYIEDYFSTYLYAGNGSAQSINNGIGLADTATWSTATLSQSATQSRYIATDSSGNVFAVGYAYDGTYYGYFLVKYSSLGVLQWQKKLQQNNSYGIGVTVDSLGNIYVVGYANDGTNNYILTAKYNTSGNIQWQRKLQQTDSRGYSVATDASNNVYVCGNPTDGTGSYILVAKYNDSGVLQWQRKIRENDSYGRGIATDSSGNVYSIGYAYDPSAGKFYCLLAKYNSSGSLQWQRKLRLNNTFGLSVNVSSSGDVYAAGYTSDSGGLEYAFLAKYNSSGTIQWQRTLVAGTYGYSVTSDQSGNVYLSGYDSNYFGMVTKYNSSGSIQWQRKIRQNTTVLWGSAVDSSGNLYVSGYATDSTQIGIFVKLKTDGSSLFGSAYVTMTNVSPVSDLPGTLTDSAGTATDSGGSATESAGGATDTAASLITSTYTQPTVSGAGGLVWIKQRSGGSYGGNALYDTARGYQYLLSTSGDGSATPAAQATAAQYDTSGSGINFTGFSPSGFSLGSDTWFNKNASGQTYVSWTFRKTPKFFDIITYTGNGSANRVIPHNLGSTPGFVIIKRYDAGGDNWSVQAIAALGFTSNLSLNLTGGNAGNGNLYLFTSGNSTTLTTASTPTYINESGASYVVYLFAHNAGGFGADGTQNVISCGSFTTDGAGNASVILGYEPQWLLVKSTGTGNWWLSDDLRGLAINTRAILFPNLANGEATGGTAYFNPTATGFDAVNNQLDPSTTYIYVAIRRGPMATPTSGTTVFNPIAYTGGTANRFLTYGFPVDVFLNIDRNGSALGSYEWPWFSRLLSYENAYRTAYDASWGGGWGSYYLSTDYNTGIKLNSGSDFLNAPNNNYVAYGFVRAPSFMDEVFYLGNGSSQSISHNLGVVPELIIVKKYSSTGAWAVYYTGNPNKFMLLNTSDASSTNTSYWNNTNPTATNFTVGSNSNTNAGGAKYSAYLFASCPGVSKVGTYTGNGTSQTINCGFTGGARFVMIKRIDDTGSWWVFDTARGMVSGTDPRTGLNSTSSESNADWVYTATTGFQIVNSNGQINSSGSPYLYLAIA